MCTGDFSMARSNVSDHLPSDELESDRCEQKTITRHIFSRLHALVTVSHTTLAQDVCPHHVIHASCAVAVLTSLRLSTLHSSLSLSSSFSFSCSSSLSSMWVGSGRSTLCASATEGLGTLADNNPLTTGMRSSAHCLKALQNMRAVMCVLTCYGVSRAGQLCSMSLHRWSRYPQ